ncbi:hypothetical protein Droror1_Dr00026021 [Drosera rotundifolia]
MGTATEAEAGPERRRRRRRRKEKQCLKREKEREGGRERALLRMTWLIMERPDHVDPRAGETIQGDNSHNLITESRDTSPDLLHTRARFKAETKFKTEERTSPDLETKFKTEARFKTETKSKLLGLGIGQIQNGGENIAAEGKGGAVGGGRRRGRRREGEEKERRRVRRIGLVAAR